MGKRDEGGLLGLLAELPWWVSVCVAIAVFVGLRFVVPAIKFNDVILTAFAQLAPQFAWVALIFLLPAAVSAFTAGRKRKLLDRQTGIESIRSLGWKQFEELLGESYRRQGFVVRENRHGGADGGIDLVIEKGGNTYLVQCKQWRSAKVGVKVVREMLGLVTAHRAQGAIIVTSGLFTQEARTFAHGKPLDLVEGHTLADLISAVARPSAARSEMKPATAVPPSDTPRRCPKCGGELVLRQARRGAHAGQPFWGCSNYPECRHIEEPAG